MAAPDWRGVLREGVNLPEALERWNAELDRGTSLEALPRARRPFPELLPIAELNTQSSVKYISSTISITYIYLPLPGCISR